MLHLRDLRIKRGLSQADVARELGISRQSYNFYENGRRDPDTTMLQTLADYFRVSTDFLLGRDKDNPKHVSDNNQAAENIVAEPDCQEIINLYQKLPQEKQALVIAMARAMQDNKI